MAIESYVSFHQLFCKQEVVKTQRKKKKKKKFGSESELREASQFPALQNSFKLEPTATFQSQFECSGLTEDTVYTSLEQPAL